MKDRPIMTRFITGMKLMTGIKRLKDRSIMTRFVTQVNVTISLATYIILENVHNGSGCILCREETPFHSFIQKKDVETRHLSCRGKNFTSLISQSTAEFPRKPIPRIIFCRVTGSHFAKFGFLLVYGHRSEKKAASYANLTRK